MTSSPLTIDGEYFRDILNQPQALEDTRRHLKASRVLEALATRVNKGKFHQLVLTGMGASYYALHPLNVALVAHGLTAVMLSPGWFAGVTPGLTWSSRRSMLQSSL